MFVQLGCLVFLLTFVWQSTDLKLQANDVSPIFSWSRRRWYLPMPLSGIIMSLVTTINLVALLRRRAAPPTNPTATEAEKAN